MGIIRQYNRLTQFVYDTMISICCKHNDLQSALKLFNNLHLWGFKLTVINCNSIIKLLVDRGDCEKAIQIYNLALNTGIIPDVHLSTTMIYLYSKSNQWENSWNTFQMMQKKFTLTTATYNGILSAAEKFPLIDVMEDIFYQMRIKNIPLDAITYAAMMSGYEKNNNYKQVNKLFYEVLYQQEYCNYIHYSIFISACYQNNDWREIEKVLNLAIKNGICYHHLGFYKNKNLIDFHIPAIFIVNKKSDDYHHEGVNRNVALALFEYHEKLQHIDYYTNLVVGYHGENLVKNAIIDLLTSKYYNKYKYIVREENLGLIELMQA